MEVTEWLSSVLGLAQQLERQAGHARQMMEQRCILPCLSGSAVSDTLMEACEELQRSYYSLRTALLNCVSLTATWTEPGGQQEPQCWPR